jgi:SPP1 gp7 family putative phage head morphogenesis protein
VDTFEDPLSLEAAYRTQLYKLVTSWIPVKLSDLSPTHWLNELASISTRKKIADESLKLVTRMVVRVNADNLKSWRTAALKAQGGPMIYHLLQEELRGKNADLYKLYIRKTSRYLTNIPQEIAEEFLEEIAKAQQQGATSSSIAKILQVRFPQVLKSKVSMLARTGVSTANTSLMRARCQELGLSCFVWESMHDQRVRVSHKKMNGIVVFWDDLPSPESLNRQPSYLGNYAPGDCPNCRCYPRPILTLQDIFKTNQTMIRVYKQGSISSYSIAQFQKLTGIESRLAA